MMQEIRLHYAPRTGVLESDMPDILIPALTMLKACRDPIDVLRLCYDGLPDLLLPALAWAASRKAFIPKWATHTVVKFCGDNFLRRTIGARKTMQLLKRYPLKESVRSL